MIILNRYKLKGDDFKKALKDFCLVSISSFVGAYLLCFIQSLIWKGTPTFIGYILDEIRGNYKYTEFRYTNFEFSLSKTKMWLKALCLYPILAGPVKLGWKNIILAFDSLPFALGILFRVFGISVIILILNYIIKNLKPKNKEILYFFAISIGLLFNAILHYFYGCSEVFIYSQHFLFLEFILLALIINNIKNKKIKIGYYIFLGIFTIVEIINNLIMYFKTTNLVMSIINGNYSLKKSISGTIFITFLAIVICLILYKNKEKSEKKIVDIFLKNILIYFGLIFTIGLFIMYNY